MGLFDSIFGGAQKKSARHQQKRAISAGEKSQDKYLSALKDFQAKSSWTPERRAEMMKGIQGFISKYVTAGKERASRTGADLGRGGGYYGGAVDRTRRAGLGMGAKQLAQTYTPPPMPGVASSAFQTYQPMAQQQEGDFGDVLGQILGIGGGMKFGQWLTG